MKRTLHTLIYLALGIFTAAGCTSATSQANKLADEQHQQTQVLQQLVQDIEKSNAAAATHIAEARVAVVVQQTESGDVAKDLHSLAASTQPVQPKDIVPVAKKADAAATQPINVLAKLDAAKAELDKTAVTTAQAPVAIQKIDTTADKAAAVTKKSDDALTAEKDHYVGYKARRLLWFVGGTLVFIIVFLVVFSGVTNGWGTIWDTLKDLFSGAASIGGSIGTTLAKTVGHVATGGAVLLANKVNAKYDAQNVPPATVVADPDKASS